MGKIVIACYQPKKGMVFKLEKLVKKHLTILRSQKLVTTRESIVMRSRDGTIVEIFEWRSDAAIESAHSNPEVMKMWEEFEEVCNYIPFGDLEESRELFQNFEPVEI